MSGRERRVIAKRLSNTTLLIWIHLNDKLLKVFVHLKKKNCKRPDVESIFKIISSNSANSISIRSVEEKINLLSNKKIENCQTKRGLD